MTLDVAMEMNWFRLAAKRNGSCGSCGRQVGKGDMIHLGYVAGDARETLCPPCAAHDGIEGVPSRKLRMDYIRAGIRAGIVDGTAVTCTRRGCRARVGEKCKNVNGRDMPVPHRERVFKLSKSDTQPPAPVAPKAPVLKLVQSRSSPSPPAERLAALADIDLKAAEKFSRARGVPISKWDTLDMITQNRYRRLVGWEG